jgi:predicted amidohydrolase YtcJ
MTGGVMMFRSSALAFILLAVMPAAAMAQSAAPDMVLLRGKIITVDDQGSTAQALAIKDGRITAVGATTAVEALAGAATIRVDLGGRTVIPGLIDSHIHALRDGLTFGVRLDWSAVATVGQALDSIREAAKNAAAGSWIVVIGGWDPNQLRERRSPTPRELSDAAPDHPVYAQELYNEAVLNREAVKALNLTDTKAPLGGQIELTDDGAVIAAGGNVRILAGFAERLPKSSFEQQVEGTRRYFRALNRTGITGILDAGGSAFVPAQYRPFFELRRRDQLSLRVRFMLTPPRAGTEFADVKNLTQMLPPRWGDDWVRFLGPGETIIWGMHDGSATAKDFTPSPAAEAALLEFASWAAEHGYPLQIHASQNSSAQRILDVFEQVDKKTPIADLRWVIIHIEDASDDTLRRMKALGVGYAVQDRLFFAGDQYVKMRPAETIRRAPPIVTAMRMGLVVSGGTDALAISSYNPFVSLRWLLDGKTVSGTATRDAKELPSRLEALRIYTKNSAWMTFDEGRRGSLEVGKLADLAVLDRDYLTVPISDIANIESVLTMVGGKVVYASAPYAQLERSK